MELIKVCYVLTMLSFLLFQCLMEGSSQETSFELPVQLIGFPFIIMAVRLTTFVKKLSYALSPVLTINVRDATMYRISLQVFAFVVLFSHLCSDVRTQDTPFELPVQLVGFPFIVGSVKLTNFLKKLSYSLSPATYRSRNRRELLGEAAEPFDVVEVEKYIVGEFGAKACVFERVCAHYATRARTQPRPQLDWPDVFSQYKRSPDQAKEYYLLSVFLGDIVGSPQLCHQLGKRRNCEKQHFD